MSTMNSGRCKLAAALVLAMMFGNGQARAQDYPSRPITVIIPFAGGSASDVVSRIMFDKMSKNMGQPIVVENRPAPAATPVRCKARAPRPMAIR